MFRAQSNIFDDVVVKATDENLTSENWEYILVRPAPFHSASHAHGAPHKALSREVAALLLQDPTTTQVVYSLPNHRMYAIKLEPLTAAQKM